MQQHGNAVEDRVFLEPAAQREAVELRQHDVADDHVWIVAACEIERFDARARAEHAEAALGQQRLDCSEILLTLVCDEYGFHRSWTRACRLRPPLQTPGPMNSVLLCLAVCAVARV
jgi:hypothetical protein